MPRRRSPSTCSGKIKKEKRESMTTSRRRRKKKLTSRTSTKKTKSTRRVRKRRYKTPTRRVRKRRVARRRKTDTEQLAYSERQIEPWKSRLRKRNNYTPIKVEDERSDPPAQWDELNGEESKLVSFTSPVVKTEPRRRERRRRFTPNSEPSRRRRRKRRLTPNSESYDEDKSPRFLKCIKVLEETWEKSPNKFLKTGTVIDLVGCPYVVARRAIQRFKNEKGPLDGYPE